MTTYELDAEAQTEIVACLAQDTDFARRTDGLIEPSYFANDIERSFVDMAISHYRKYGETPSKTAWAELIKGAFARKHFRNDQKQEVVNAIQALFKLEVRSREWLLDSVVEFAQQQAILQAMAGSVPLLQPSNHDPDRFKAVKEKFLKAFDVSLEAVDDDYDYFENIEARTKERLDVAAGGRPKTGITTGVKELDDLLMHKGWGKRELSLLMGGAKSSKSFHLYDFASNAVLEGYNVLIVTLENSKNIVATRIDAKLSKVKISEQYTSPNTMGIGVQNVAAKAGVGKLKIREFPSGSFRPSDLRRLIDRYKTKGIVFDLVVIDYLDIMSPDIVTDSDVTNNKSIFVNVRGIAQAEGFAILSATQTNREGHKSSVVKAEHVAEDFNKIRIADIVLSINRTDDERANGKARIMFAAARNQADSYVVFVKQNLDLGLAIEEVESVE